MRFMREPGPWPQIRTGLPLLSAMDPLANDRKGPYAMNVLAEYVGEERIEAALRTLIEKKASSPATTLDLYRKLKAVTPDSLKPLWHSDVTVTVPARPAHGGIDPYNLLDREEGDTIEAIGMEER